MTPNGIAEVGQIELNLAPTEPNHAVRLQDLGGVVSSGISETSLFSGKNVAGATNGRAITVDGSGNPVNYSTASASPNVIAIKSGGKYYLRGTIIKNFAVGLTPGAQYFINGTAGTISTTAETTSGRWSIIAGIALNTTDLVVTLENVGQI